MEKNWIELAKEKPKMEDYYRVRFDDGTEDEKPYRIRPKQNIDGFMTERTVTHWLKHE